MSASLAATGNAAGGSHARAVGGAETLRSVEKGCWQDVKPKERVKTFGHAGEAAETQTTVLGEPAKTWEQSAPKEGRKEQNTLHSLT